MCGNSDSYQSSTSSILPLHWNTQPAKLDKPVLAVKLQQVTYALIRFILNPYY